MACNRGVDQQDQECEQDEDLDDNVLLLRLLTVVFFVVFVVHARINLVFIVVHCKVNNNPHVVDHHGHNCQNAGNPQELPLRLSFTPGKAREHDDRDPEDDQDGEADQAEVEVNILIKASENRVECQRECNQE